MNFAPRLRFKVWEFPWLLFLLSLLLSAGALIRSAPMGEKKNKKEGKQQIAVFCCERTFCYATLVPATEIEARGK